MPTNQTPNYNLSQWEAEDKVLRTDFNADNAKIDAALKAGADAQTALAAQVAEKAAQSDLTAEIDARKALDTTVSKLGNCIVVNMSYTGTGGSQHTLTFEHRPVFIYVSHIRDAYAIAAPRGVTRCVAWSGDANRASLLSWSGNSVTIDAGFDSSNSTYYVTALLDASK